MVPRYRALCGVKHPTPYTLFFVSTYNGANCGGICHMTYRTCHGKLSEAVEYASYHHFHTHTHRNNILFCNVEQTVTHFQSTPKYHTVPVRDIILFILSNTRSGRRQSDIILRTYKWDALYS